MKARAVTQRIRGRETRDGAGVKLRRIFGADEVEAMDPFLLLDDFGSPRAEDYLAGFPWHPHRGIETVTYLFSGKVAHGDSLGNAGALGPGDLQWMTAGSGIIHEEMPQESPEGLRGLQLWVNLAASEKMGDPAYHGVLAAMVPEKRFNGGSVKVLAGTYEGITGPIAGIARSPLYLDFALEAGASVEVALPQGATVFAYLVEGEILDDALPGKAALRGDCLVYGPGEGLVLKAGSPGCRLVVAAAQALKEPIVWAGPIVMNTREEIELAYQELEDGTFIKAKPRT